MKPQDVVVLIKLFLLKDKKRTIALIAHSVFLSISETHAAIKRLILSGLYDSALQVPRKAAMEEFLVHAVKYIFPVEIGTEVRGISTAHSASPLANKIRSSNKDMYVWPYEFGNKRGLSITPLYPTVPQAVQNDSELYKILALIDALRIGRARDRILAQNEIIKIIRTK